MLEKIKEKAIVSTRTGLWGKILGQQFVDWITVKIENKFIPIFDAIQKQALLQKEKKEILENLCEIQRFARDFDISITIPQEEGISPSDTHAYVEKLKNLYSQSTEAIRTMLKFTREYQEQIRKSLPKILYNPCDSRRSGTINSFCLIC